MSSKMLWRKQTALTSVRNSLCCCSCCCIVLLFNCNVYIRQDFCYTENESGSCILTSFSSLKGVSMLATCLSTLCFCLLIFFKCTYSDFCLFSLSQKYFQQSAMRTVSKVNDACVMKNMVIEYFYSIFFFFVCLSSL